MAKEKKTEVTENQQTAPAIEFINDVNVPIEVREEIVKKAEELKAQHKLRKIFIIVVEGEEGDDCLLYTSPSPRDCS